MTLSLDGAQERVVGSNQAVVRCVSAMWTYRYHNGYTVTLRGPFTASAAVIRNDTLDGTEARTASAPPSTFILKFDHIQFDSNVYEKRVAVDAIGGNRLDTNNVLQFRDASTPTSIIYERAFIPADPVDAFGIPHATMRCLEVGSPNSMYSPL
jgi:LIM-domain binding protein